MNIEVINNNIIVNNTYYAPMKKTTRISDVINFHDIHTRFREHVKNHSRYMIKWNYQLKLGDHHSTLLHTTQIEDSWKAAEIAACMPPHLTAVVGVRDGDIHDIVKTSGDEKNNVTVFNVMSDYTALTDYPEDGDYLFDTDTSEFINHYVSYLNTPYNDNDHQVVLKRGKKFRYVDAMCRDQVFGEDRHYDPFVVFEKDDRYSYVYDPRMNLAPDENMRSDYTTNSSHWHIQLFAVPHSLLDEW